jgi:hypothetical protein
MDEKEKEEFWEDLGRPEKYQFAFTIIAHEEGGVTTVTSTEGVSRKATTFDIYQACKEIVNDIESLMLADRVTKSVVAALTQGPNEQVKEKLRSALSERGIDTSNA